MYQCGHVVLRATKITFGLLEHARAAMFIYNLVEQQQQTLVSGHLLTLFMQI